MGDYVPELTASLDALDLTATTLSVTLKSENLDLKGGQLYFWFQSHMPDGKYVNYAYTAQPVNLLLGNNGDYNSIQIKLSSAPADWTCLGSSVARANTYGCAPLLDAMTRVNVDLGFIILPVDALPLQEAQPPGTISIRSITLTKVI